VARVDRASCTPVKSSDPDRADSRLLRAPVALTGPQLRHPEVVMNDPRIRGAIHGALQHGRPLPHTHVV